MEDTSQERDEANDPAQAFEDLRAEVWVMRRAVEALPIAWAENQPPDYSPDLGRVVKGLNEVAARLDDINKHPALTMRPEQYRQAITQAGEGLVREAVGKFDQAVKDVGRERQQLAGLIGVARVQEEQREWLWWIGGIAAVVALIIGLVASPYLVGRFFWGSWQAGVAAIVMGTDRWDAGAAIMRAGSPEGWKNIVYDYNLVNDNQKEINKCREDAVKARMDQRCTITVSLNKKGN